MGQRLQIKLKDGAQHLVEGGVFGTKDFGKLHARWDGNLETRNLLSPNVVLEDRSPLLSPPGSEFRVERSGGETGVMRQEWLSDDFVYEADADSE